MRPLLLSRVNPVTPSDGSKTWGRSAVCKKEDSNKKKLRTWGPSSTQPKERVGGEEKYVFLYLVKLCSVQFHQRVLKSPKMLGTAQLKNMFLRIVLDNILLFELYYGKSINQSIN